MTRIFLTTGTQLPFDRLVAAVDEWCENHRDISVYAQTCAGAYQPKNMAFSAHLEGEAYQRQVSDCDLLVAHAGMGSILTAIENGKPIILMARDYARGEHRNDHQKSTVDQFRNLSGIYVADTVDELRDLLDRRGELLAPSAVFSESRNRLIGFISQFIDGKTAEPSREPKQEQLQSADEP